MARKPKTVQPDRDEPIDRPEDIRQALDRVTATIQATNDQLARLMQLLETRRDGGEAAGRAGQAAEINTYEEDPFSEVMVTANPPQAPTVAVRSAVSSNPKLRIAIREPRPAVARYNAGTAEFRYWMAADTLARAVNFWDELLPPGTTWSAANPMQVTLVEAQPWLNAQYIRGSGLHFYRDTVGNGRSIFTVESPDVVRHELGHAVLDALKPQIFHAASLEASAFHESFGDISAILCALQHEPVRRGIIEETGGHLNVTSRLSRVAEQLGWALRQISPTAVDRDSLRNASNRFFYKRPDLLPPSAPSSVLSSESHSFSRVFTGAFLDALAGMFVTAGAAHEQTLLTVSRNIGQLIVDAVHTSGVPFDYFSEIAAAMIQADRARFGGLNGPALTRAFTKRGILSLASAADLAAAPVPAMAAMRAAGGIAPGLAPLPLAYGNEAVDPAFSLGRGETPDLPKTSVSIGGLTIAVHASKAGPRLGARPAQFGAMAVAPQRAGTEIELFVEGLVQRGELDARASGPAIANTALIIASSLEIVTSTPMRQTHFLATEEGELVLKRNHFTCFGCIRSAGGGLFSCG